MGGFQTVVNTQPAPAVEGDFCNTNPRFSVDAGPGGLQALAAADAADNHITPRDLLLIVSGRVAITAKEETVT
jgi:hypothetical protein